MGIKPVFKMSDIKKHILKGAKLIDEAIVLRFTYIGEQFVKDARNNANFGDITGNLRSSIGYIVLRNGKRVGGSVFEVVKKGTKGVKSGKSLISELRAQFSTGYVLIVVAGMDYAAAVESRGKDVLTASSITAKNSLKAAMISISQKLSGKK